MKIGAAILAAGASRRLGRPKQLLEIDGEPLVVRTAQAIAASGVAPIGAVVGASADGVAAALASLPIAVVSCPDWEEGMAASIRAAARWAIDQRLDALLVATCDQHRLDAVHVLRIVTALRGGRPLVASGYAGTRGVPAGFSLRFFSTLATLEGDRGARDLLRHEPTTFVVPFPAGALDLDAPADLPAAGLSCSRSPSSSTSEDRASASTAAPAPRPPSRAPFHG